MIPSDSLLKSATAWKVLLKSNPTEEKAAELADEIIVAEFSDAELDWLHEFFRADDWSTERREFIYREGNNKDFLDLVEYMFDLIDGE